jgi:hypothetical protein
MPRGKEIAKGKHQWYEEAKVRKIMKVNARRSETVGEQQS